MADVMMKLGSFGFQTDTAAYQELRRESEYRWQQQSRLGVAPAQQFMGVGGDEISLNGVVFPVLMHNKNTRPMEALRTLAKQGKPLRLIAAPQGNTGYILGLWVIAQVGETDTHFAKGGLPQKVEFTLHLKAYGG